MLSGSSDFLEGPLSLSNLEMVMLGVKMSCYGIITIALLKVYMI